jgi:murein L,D-transpeptidase YcbB/YkuD
MEKTLLILNIFAILGFPTVFAIVVAILKKMGKFQNQIKILMNSQQAQMRSQLLKDYYTYKRRGFVYEAELSDWMSQYDAYHSLGANGIMDKRKEALLDLDTKAEIE